MTKPTTEIPREDVIEITCDLADEALRAYWANHGIITPIYIEEEDSTSYTEAAQDRFNDIYDWIEGEVLELIEENPTLGILEIEALHRKGTNNEVSSNI